MTREELWQQIGEIGIKENDPYFHATYRAHLNSLGHDDEGLLLQLLKMLKRDKDKFFTLALNAKINEAPQPLVLCKCCTPAVKL